MMNSQNFFVALFLSGAVLFASCQGSETATDETTVTDSTVNTASAGPSINLVPVDNATDFPDAQLSMGNVTASPSGDSVKLSFNFNVRNYDLKAQTSDSNSKLCSNSAQGQHIHFILDNMPYVALYEPKHETTVAKNTEHHLLAFLSRSYHLSLKNKDAALVYSFKIDENGKLQKIPTPTTPMVFYSRPKGDYIGKDTENVLFDFYVWNTALGNDNQVRADINAGGRDTSMMINEWRPYFLQNLPMGKATIKLTMLDKDGNKVNGPEAEVSREINLSQDEPMQQ